MCMDLTRGSNGLKYIVPQPGQRVTRARSASGSNKILTRKVTTNAALLVSATLAMLSSHQSKHAYVSAFHEPDPKNQREMRASRHVEEWK
eukprot:3741647-Rhodomonas_salina.1